MEQSLHIYENVLWDILDDSSKIYILTLLIKNGFRGECRLNAEVDRNTPEYKVIIVINDEEGKVMDLPLDVLNILNN